MPAPFQKLTEIQAYLSTNGLNAQKKFGQNFLIDQNIVRFIVESGRPYVSEGNTEVAEIGIGLGTLTYPILEFQKPTHLFEIDKAYIELAREKYLPEFPQAVLYEGDALKNLSHVFEKEIFIFGNLPYNLTSDILTLISTECSSWKGGIFMVQKEFAERITGEISSLSLFLEGLGKTELLKTVHKKCFYPAPKVDSALIRILPYPQEKRIFKNKAEIQIWSRLLRTFFWGKRKQIQVSLRESPFSADPFFQESVRLSWEKLKIPANARPEELNRKQFLTLGQELLDHMSQ
ncbi:16S rRNA (adenine(1518)-N(6)/adenine(1519)-N(6))-dimethyltransferase RsmA [Leptospira idonii]|uniref:Ribosomal RNA small subunit methyltransferase A n=1 Tax=Leptospira idonii TaxID=1193500 RepID=A0A4R9M1G0_9LEPT|nr:16S rRNA (adenine(1518)-N(6)/adenine(1519)-N(6))-dimethyltransferase RsmA [Leptospira idonii]TGN20594.1 ribosomal RNA small subunit methyltransferase A [Leptospira idonii]